MRHSLIVAACLALGASFAQRAAAENSLLFNPTGGGLAALNDPARKLVRTFLAAAQIQPAITVRADPPAESGFGVRFRSGEAVYLGLSAPPGGRRKISLSFARLNPSKRCVYDVRAQKYLGRAVSLEYAMKDSDGELLALLPRQIGEVSLRAPKRAERGRPAPVSLALDGWKPDLGRTVFRLEVYDPAGNLNTAYTRTIGCEAGRADPAIPFALNDPPGDWRFRAIEVVSGHSDEARMTVSGD
jgi:hypothetical protein